MMVVEGHWKYAPLWRTLAVRTAVGLGRHAEPLPDVFFAEEPLARESASRIENVGIRASAKARDVGDASADQVVLKLAGDVLQVAGLAHPEVGS